MIKGVLPISCIRCTLFVFLCIFDKIIFFYSEKIDKIKQPEISTMVQQAYCVSVHFYHSHPACCRRLGRGISTEIQILILLYSIPWREKNLWCECDRNFFLLKT